MGAGEAKTAAQDDEADLTRSLSSGQARRAWSESIPAQLGRFAIVGMLGEGGMGIVYRARDPALDRDVALKVVPSTQTDMASRERLLREAQAMGRVAHPNVVSVYEVGAHEGVLFIAMELIQGETLGQWLVSEKRSYRAILDKFIQAGRGLAAAHREAVLHRDFKPSNVIVANDGRARVLDFGLARYTDEPESFLSGPISPDSPLASPLTQFGDLVGTPTYMSPEHFRGDVSAASDQWSLCVAMYRALFGRAPFEAKGVKELFEIISTQSARVPEQTEVPERIVDIIMRGLSREADARWPSIDALADALSAELRIDPELDPLAFRKERRVAAVIMGAAVALNASVLGLAPDIIPKDGLEIALLGGLFGFVTLLGIMIAVRRSLVRSVHHRHVMLVFALAIGVTCMHRGLMLGSAIDVAHVLRIDAVVCAALYALGAVTIERWLAGAATLMASYMLFNVLAPGLALPGYSLTSLMIVLLAIWFWRPTTRHPRHRR